LTVISVTVDATSNRLVATSVVIWVLSYYPRTEAVHAKFEEQRRSLATAVLEPTQRDRQLDEIAAAEAAAFSEQSWLRAGIMGGSLQAEGGRSKAEDRSPQSEDRGRMTGRGVCAAECGAPNNV